jgi:hypothetical protein
MQKTIIGILNGSVRVEIDGNDPREIIPALAFWQSLPIECPVCHSSLVFEYTTPQTYKYYKLRCTGTTPHCVNLSQRSNDPAQFYFDRQKTWEIFRPGRPDGDGEELATPAAALPDPAHQNQPDGVRGSLIAQIRQLHTDAQAKGIYVNLDLNKIGGQSEQQLQGVKNFLIGMIEKPPRR